ncbi:uncharacterized protein LOC126836382 [Adelges cooleyi]|uniref:uncharacterized protein LOC126836382 n=1 Tax=Adelges cooleyi TaxID=133065 RepID=UPI00217FC7A1|nr:uncharacterized protein LOC126836382 [Adelges cooleyi]
MSIEKKISILAAPITIYEGEEGWDFPDSLEAYEKDLQRSMSIYGKDPRRLSIISEQITLAKLGIDRRKRIKGSVLGLLQAVEALYNEKQFVFKDQSHHFGLEQRCHLVALFVTIENPSRHIFYSHSSTFKGNHGCRFKYDKYAIESKEIEYRMWDDGYYYEVLPDHHTQGRKLTPRLKPGQKRGCAIN